MLEKCGTDEYNMKTDPRTSGDGPHGRSMSKSNCARPPHERGWTSDGYADLEVEIQTPARAGMDPDRMLFKSPSVTDPRTSGDGPF